MSHAIVTNVLVGFLVGMVIALILARLIVPPHGRGAVRSDDAAAWASVLNQALRELKIREAEADSQRERAETRASQAEFLYRMILDTVPNGVVTFDSSGGVVTANPVARRLLASSPGELPAPLASQLTAALRGVSPPYVEVDLAVGGTTVPVGVQTRPLGAAGTTAGAVMVLGELSELRRLQTRARLMEELADLGQLTAGIAHEFRNASGTLRASAQFLADKVNGPARDAVDDLLKETDRLSRVTTELLDVARPWERGIEPVELDELARQAVAQLEGAYPRARVELALGCPGKTVLGKGTLISRVIDNLIRNAIEAGNPTDPVLVETALCEKGGRWVLLRVADRGCGIGDLDAEDLFLPFRTTKPGGTGMGLTLARKIARLHGGTVTLANREGGGAVSTLRLPVAEDSESA